LFSYDISLAADFPAPFSFLASMAENRVLSILDLVDILLEKRYMTGDVPYLDSLSSEN
jgi:hypothetical protein